MTLGERHGHYSKSSSNKDGAGSARESLYPQLVAIAKGKPFAATYYKPSECKVLEALIQKRVAWLFPRRPQNPHGEVDSDSASFLAWVYMLETSIHKIGIRDTIGSKAT